MAWNRPDRGTPFVRPMGDGLPNGVGKDSTVRTLKGEKKNTDYPGIVIKVDHIDTRNPPTADDALSKALYLKNKYEILKEFLGDFIPHSAFVVGEQEHGKRLRTHVFTRQDRVPQVRINQLTEAQRNDPRLIRNLHTLFTRLLAMHERVRKINAGVPPESRIDLSLDLGAVSRIIKDARDLHAIGSERITPEIFDSPNILIDPSTMRPYCIDFGKGTWNNGKEATKLFLLRAAQELRGKIPEYA